MILYTTQNSRLSNRELPAVVYSIIFFSLISVFSIQNTFVYAQDTLPPKQVKKSQGKDEIPEEFRRIGKGLPPSKRKKLQKWIWKLQFESTYPRMRAAREIYWYKDTEAIPYLVKALRDPYWGVRMSSVKALAYLGVKKYSYATFRLPDYEKIRNLEETLVRKKISLAQKGEILLKSETIGFVKHNVDVIKELKKAYYREVQIFKNDFVKIQIRLALENLGAIKKINGLDVDTYSQNRKLNNKD